MSRCIDCVWFPWVPDADFSMLPPMKCAKEMEARRWTKEAATVEHNCSYFEKVKAVIKDDADTRTEDKAEEVSGRKNTRKRK